jgi:hypothetical protein
MSLHLTTQELDAARARYRGQIIPADALSAMDAETENVVTLVYTRTGAQQRPPPVPHH